MLDQLVGGGHQMQCLPRVTPVSRLAPRPLAAAPALAAPALAAPALAARALASERIARWWFAAVVAIFGETGLQLPVLGQQLLHLRPQRGHLGLHLGDAVLCCAHGTMLHLHRKSAGTVPLED
jgi:hypothetical protein